MTAFEYLVISGLFANASVAGRDGRRDIGFLLVSWVSFGFAISALVNS